jgi:hypothetical protein
VGDALLDLGDLFIGLQQGLAVAEYTCCWVQDRLHLYSYLIVPNSRKLFRKPERWRRKLRRRSLQGQAVGSAQGMSVDDAGLVRDVVRSPRTALLREASIFKVMALGPP